MKRYLTLLFIFSLAFIPRWLNLGQFLTADEFLWVDRARNFLAGLTDPNFTCDTRIPGQLVAQGLACTLRTGHPGVTTMWSGVLGFILRWLWEGRPHPLHEYVVAVATNPLDASFISWERFGVVLLTALAITAIYALNRRLFSEPIAFTAALLMSLNPFHIALSRVIHHDALSTSFMVLSVLCALLYWRDPPFNTPSHLKQWLYARRWLIFSGICAGLAFLSKLPSLFLGPMIALIGLWFTYKSSPSRAPAALAWLVLDGLFWFALAVITFITFWPAMWVIPLQTLEVVFFLGSQYSSGGHAKGSFFLGEVFKDPGLFFYPVTWLYRTTPWVMLGVSVALFHWLKTLRRRADTSLTTALSLIFIFIISYTLMMSVVAKKQERYLLPIYPWLDLVAAIGLIKTLNFLKPRYATLTLHLTTYSLLILFNGYFIYQTYPYYFTYANPLLGGLKGAEQAITLGWGEGLDLAAEYLNQAGPPYPRVTSWYQSTFAPFYRGEAISYSEEKGKALAGDRVIFYINQTQRHFPDDLFFEYFQSRFQPLKVITLQGVDHVWIYPSLGIDHYVTDQTYTGIASLLAWQWQHGDKPLLTGQPAPFELFWEYLGKAPQEQFFMQLIDAQGRVQTQGRSQTLNPPASPWRMGEIIQEQGILTPPVGLAPGQYQLQIGFYTQAEAVKEGYLLFTLPITESQIRVEANSTLTFTLPSEMMKINQKLGDNLTLLGAKHVITGNILRPELYWRVDNPIPATFEVHVGLMNQRHEAQQAWFNLTLAEIYQPEQTTWPAGTILHTQWPLDLSTDLATATYYLELIVGSNTQQTLALPQLPLKP